MEWMDYPRSGTTTFQPRYRQKVHVQFRMINKSTLTELCQRTSRISSSGIMGKNGDVGNKNRNDSGHRGSIGSHATFNERKFKEDYEEPKRRNHPGNRIMWDGPHSSENIINSTTEIRVFVPKESGRNLG
ncbi:unnamed protein product [Allacma fusca]|uniref:Uncharacterized protein n=1 Tax=Allacma fusca TaxID=39272 RepID=A0A8J2P9G5_9HEXA|nr:unnamed protein product [Allacma fusca]